MHDIFSSPTPATGYALADFIPKRMVLSPGHWKKFSLAERLDWQRIQFDRANLKNVPANQKGVYTFVVRPGIANHPECGFLMYVGMVARQAFRDRFSQYLNEQRAGDDSRRVHVTELLRKWDGHLWFYFAPIKAKRRIKTAEDALLAAYLPNSNRTFPASVRRQVAKLFS